MGAPLNAFMGGYPEMAENAEIAKLRADNKALRDALHIANQHSNWMLMIDEICCEYGPPEYVKTEDDEAWYWRFAGHDLPVADNLSELFIAARDLQARAALAATGQEGG